MKTSIFKWEIIGIIAIILFGASLHFVFEWTGEWRPAAVIAAVNESTWEHFKIGFWPALIFALIEFPFIRRSCKNFWFAKGMGIFFIPLTIFILFYGYTAFLEDSLIADILVFVVAVIVGEFVSYRILTAKRDLPQWTVTLGVVLLLVMTAAFATLSYYPPHNFLFLDPVTGTYGIP
jgi:hypothetical protein